MSTRVPGWAVRGVAWLALAAVLGWPAAAILIRGVSDGAAQAAEVVPSARQLTLLWHSAQLAASATAVSMLLALPAAIVLGNGGRLSRHPLLLGLMVANLLCPPTVFVFGWSRLMPASLSPALQCILVWALWCWPIPAFVLAAGWSRAGRAALHAARLDAGLGRALSHVVLPGLRAHAALAGLIVFVLLLHDYSVPHACAMVVYATELLAWASAWGGTGAALATALPAMGVVLVSLPLAYLLWRASAAEESAGEVAEPARPSWLVALPGTVAAACVTAPLAALSADLSSWQAMGEAWQVYRGALGWSLGLAAATGLLAVGLGGAVAGPRDRRAPNLWHVADWASCAAWLAAGAMPGALIGGAMVVAYQRVPVVYDHWPIIVLALLARYGWIGGAGWLVVQRMTPQGLVDAARVDGAHGAALARLLAGLSWPVLGAAAGVVAALALADISTTALVQVPGIRLLPHVLIEKFHRFEDDMLICLSFWLSGAGLAGAGLLAWATRRLERHGP